MTIKTTYVCDGCGAETVDGPGYCQVGLFVGTRDYIPSRPYLTIGPMRYEVLLCPDCLYSLGVHANSKETKEIEPKERLTLSMAQKFLKLIRAIR